MNTETNGVRLHVEVSGEGPALLLLHGFTGSTRTWDRFIPEWSERYRTIAVDVIGHGQSDSPQDRSRYSMQHAVQDLAAVLDQLHIEQAAVLGYSMGGRLALSMAVLQPHRVRALLLESSSPGLKTEEEREARVRQDEALADRIEREGIERFVDHWENLAMFQNLKRMPPDVQRNIRSERLGNRPIGLANSLRGMGTGAQPSWWHALDSLNMPVLLTAGEEDEKFYRIAHEMKSIVSDCTFVPVKQAGHTIHVEQAEIFGTIIKEYLDTQF